MQSLIPSVYPILKESYALDFAQIGLITLAFQFTASLLQPVVGHFTDRKARPFRNLDGSCARGLDRGAVRPDEHRVVLLDRICGDHYPVADRVLVQTADHGKKDGADRGASKCAELPSGHDRACSA